MKRLFLKLLALLPSKLPVGVQEFDSWAKDIIALLDKGLQEVPVDQVKFALASIIMHLGSTTKTKSKAYFVACLHKTAANQVASQVFQDIKVAQLEAQKAAEAAAVAQTQEVTTEKEVTNAGETQN